MFRLRLTHRDTKENFKFRGGSKRLCKDDPFELVERVVAGVKPMASIGMNDCRGQSAYERATTVYGLTAYPIVNRWGMHVATVCQPDATLADYYNVDGIIARYAKVGVTIPPQNFTCKLESFSPNVLNERFDDEVLLYPMLGLLYGFPIKTTMKLL